MGILRLMILKAASCPHPTLLREGYTILRYAGGF
jgi:hypothetical protein